MIFAVFLSSLLSSAFAEAQDYAFLSNKGNLYVKVYKADTIASSMAHDHAIQAVGWSGKATWDTESIANCSVSITVPVNNLYVDKTEVRKLAGLPGEISDSQRQEIKGNMLSEGQLNADKYPLITFVSTGCEQQGSSTILKGNFSMRGKTNAVRVPITVSNTDGLQIKGTFNLKATEYGFQPYSAMFGAVANKDQMEIYFDLQAATQQ